MGSYLGWERVAGESISEVAAQTEMKPTYVWIDGGSYELISEPNEKGNSWLFQLKGSRAISDDDTTLFTLPIKSTN